jgi:hypothetical protein
MRPPFLTSKLKTMTKVNKSRQMVRIGTILSNGRYEARVTEIIGRRKLYGLDMGTMSIARPTNFLYVRVEYLNAKTRSGTPRVGTWAADLCKVVEGE